MQSVLALHHEPVVPLPATTVVVVLALTVELVVVVVVVVEFWAETAEKRQAARARAMSLFI
jgi:hypothetical protein